MPGRNRIRLGHLLRVACALTFVVLVVPVSPSSGAATSRTVTVSDASDAPEGAQGKTDLRSVTWSVTADTTTLTVGVDTSVYGDAALPAELGLHVLVDTDRDGLADVEVAAKRDTDGKRVDVDLRQLDQALSTTDCQDVAGKATGASATVASTTANGRETFSFSFRTDAVDGGLDNFQWAALGQSPADPAQAGPWDYLPNRANPGPDVPNPGDRRCNAMKSGLRMNMSMGQGFTVASCPGHASDPRNQLVGTAAGDRLTGTSLPDVICGLGGADTLRGLGGNDVLTGGSGGDIVDGGTGADKLTGEDGRDTLTGDAGDDDLRGGAGNDRLEGRSGVDHCQGGTGVDTLVGCES